MALVLTTRFRDVRLSFQATKELRSHDISMKQTETTTFFRISQSEVELSLFVKLPYWSLTLQPQQTYVTVACRHLQVRLK